MLDPSQTLAQFLSGCSYASTLFLVSSGLSIIFGVTRIVNFAHGSFFMIGAYVACSLTARLPASPLGFWTGILGAALIVGLLGVLMEVLVLRRIYRAPGLFQIVATFAVILIVQDLVQTIWGPDEIFSPRAPGLRDAVDIAGQLFPEYDLALIAIGPLVLGVIWLILHRTRWGILIRAATQDREMAASLGINQSLLFTSVVFLGCLLAGLAGALQIPKDTANLQMDINIITEAFVVVVVGGMGSVFGAFLAALIIGQTHAFGIVAFPSLTLVITFLLMAVVLVVRPLGLFGHSIRAPRVQGPAVDPLRRMQDRRVRLGIFILLAILLALPAVVKSYGLILLAEIFILAIFAGSLHLLMAYGGMVSFGHAAYFGVGAYAAAWFTAHLAAPMFPALAVAMLAAALAAAVVGWFCTRLGGVYFAMLTLAFAQIFWSIAVQWIDITGGDNGILGVRRSEWLQSATAFYYFALIVACTALYLLRRLVFAPFGYSLRAVRDSPLRSDAVGMYGRRHQWAAFVVAGLLAGLAGGLSAFQRGSVFPNDLSIAMSIDGLVMVLLGGIQTLTGPIVGAAAYHILQAELLRHFEGHWRLILGAIIIVLVVAFPHGIVGSLKRYFSRPLRLWGAA
jgi:branched-chain amino acid transport system permease protein